MKEIINNFLQIQSNKETLYKSKQSVFDTVKQARKTIDNHLDKVEAAAHE